MRYSTLAVICGMFVCGALLSGCGSDNKSSQGAIQAVEGKEAREMNSARGEFEKSEDPPLTASTHFAAGQLNETQGAPALAIEQYEMALKLDPKFSAALFRLGIVYSQLKQYPKSIDAWNRYIEVTNQAAAGYSNLGYCQELAGDAEAAEKSYQAGIERDASSEPCRVNYGLMLARQGRIEEAKEQFGAVLSPAEAHYNIASVLQQQGKKDAARAEFKEAIKTDPKLIDAASRLAELERN